MADSVVLLDDRQWRDFLRKIKGNLAAPYKLLKVAAMTYGFANIIDHFKKEEGSGGAWKKRKPSTQRAYARLSMRDRRFNPSNKLLQLTGHLRQTLLPSSEGIKPAGKMGALMFSTSKVGIYHQKGTSKMVKRDFMWLSGATQQKMADLLLRMAVGV